MSDEAAHETREAAFEAADDVPVNPDTEDSIGAVIARRYDRRHVLRGALGVTAAAALFGTTALARAPAGTAAPDFKFDEIEGGIDEKHHLAAGYEADVLIAWGDPIHAGMAPFDPLKLDGAEQRRRFGYNNDYIAFFPLERSGKRGLLCVNHEYTSPEVMFAGINRLSRADLSKITREHVEVEMAAHGVTVVEIALTDGRWRPVLDSRHNRRITADTPMTVDGPAAGHTRLRTSADREGRTILGTINNCAGGQTPWGTYLTAEENFHGYFWTDQRDAQGRPSPVTGTSEETRSRARYRIPSNWYNWGRYVERFDVAKEPNESNRFGWIVEIDPSDPASTPVKHTALGRFSHEGAETLINKDGRVVIYSGDDARFEYVYRFVSKGRYRPGDKAHNMRLLSEGTLSVARFNDDGTLDWLPLVFGEGPLTPANGFHSQADVLIDARLAADLLKATPMDRPEDVEARPRSGKVYLLLTNNSQRKPEQADAANPRAVNYFGHIIEMTAPGEDHAADRFYWDILLKCGDPAVAEVGALWGPGTSQHGWFSSPDNCAFDAEGRLWIATDQGNDWKRTGKADGLFAVDTDGSNRGRSRLFFRAPVGAEVCGPYFTPDSETLFIAVQHPGVDGTRDWKPFMRPSTFEDPATRWPDFKPGMPPRPAVLAIRKKGGGRIAT